jgi:hypothetical protein
MRGTVEADINWRGLAKQKLLDEFLGEFEVKCEDDEKHPIFHSFNSGADNLEDSKGFVCSADASCHTLHCEDHFSSYL